MREKLRKIIKSKWFMAGAGFLLGAAVILGIRFATYAPETIHYHANFALYINGQREAFKGQQYYAETQMCTESAAMTPGERAHMHDNVNDVVHVEDHAATWGQFFENLGWYMGPNFIQSPDGTMYLASGDSQLHLVLNGQDYTDLGGVANAVIKDQDKLLVSFGNESNAALMAQYVAIPSTAHQYDMSKDTGSCGSHSATTIHERLTHLF